MKSNWGIKETTQRVVQNLFKSLSFLFLNAYGRESHTEILQRLFAMIDGPLGESIITSIGSTTSRLRLPSLFVSFNHASVTFYSCIADILTISKVMETQMKLPLSVANFATEGTPTNAMFWFRIFPKHGSREFDSNIPLIFHPPENPLPVIAENPEFERIWRQLGSVLEDPYKHVLESDSYDDTFRQYALKMSIVELSDVAESFEELMTFRMWLHQIAEWQVIAEEHERIILMPIAALAANQAHRRHYPTVELAFIKAARLFKSPMIKQDQFLILLELYLPIMMKHATYNIQKLASLWKIFLAEKLERVDMTVLRLRNQAAKSVFWEAVHVLRSLDSEPFRGSFRTIVRGTRFLSELNLRDEDFIHAIVLSQSGRLLPLYVVISRFGMNSQAFRMLCTEQEMANWVKIESVLLKMVMEDGTLSRVFFSLRENGEMEKKKTV
jgi:hypothetical protein